MTPKQRAEKLAKCLRKDEFETESSGGGSVLANWADILESEIQAAINETWEQAAIYVDQSEAIIDPYGNSVEIESLDEAHFEVKELSKKLRSQVRK